MGRLGAILVLILAVYGGFAIINQVTTQLEPTPTPEPPPTRIVEDTDPPRPTVIVEVTDPPIPTTSPPDQARKVAIGLNPPQGRVVPEGELYVANGDVDTTGTCHIVVFGPGQEVSGLSDTGTWELWRITGGTEVQQRRLVTQIQEGAARDPGNPTGSCPEL